MDRYQSSLKSPVALTGTGLHCARGVRLEVLPAPANHGVVFQRTDLPGAEPIKASFANVQSTDLSTTIGRVENSVATIEHLMAALAGLGIDNALVRIDAPEVPILDGSSVLFV